MQVIKKINNNAAICIDKQGNELIAIGTGIGFPEVPYEIDTLKCIQRTYYDINPIYYDLLNQVPTEIFDLSYDIFQLYRDKFNSTISNNIVFTLADHIHFAIERCRKNIQIDNPLQYDIKHLYEREYAIGLEALRMIKKRFTQYLPETEAGNIALHFMNAEAVAATSHKDFTNDIIIDGIIEIIGEFFNIHIDKTDISYSRFITHMQYLLKRGKNKMLHTENELIFKSVVEQYPQTYLCAEKINCLLSNELDINMSNEETLYLMLHINRLYVKEDCYRKGITQ